jgi:hypothetical protein
MKTICFLFALGCILQHLCAQHVFPKNGPVGINTLQPRVALDVNGITYSNSLVLGSLPANRIGLFQLHYTGAISDTALLVISNGDRRIFQVSNNGTVRAREVLVNLKNDWPDYVFSPHYKLRSLPELECYLNQYQHLPGIPNAASVEQNGIGLAEMNRLLLEKVEELTLYLIEQEKRIQTLEKQLKDSK